MLEAQFAHDIMLQRAQHANTDDIALGDVSSRDVLRTQDENDPIVINLRGPRTDHAILTLILLETHGVDAVMEGVEPHSSAELLSTLSWPKQEFGQNRRNWYPTYCLARRKDYADRNHQ